MHRRDADERREDFWGAGPDFFETVVFEPDETTADQSPPECSESSLGALFGKPPAFPEISLSWHLTSCEVSRLKEGIRGREGAPSCADRRRLQAWWTGKTTPGTSPASLPCPPD